MGTGQVGMEAIASFQNSPGLEYLKELSRGSFGVLWLARVVTGSEVGRLVVARRLSLAQVPGAHADRVLAAARNYSVLSHPSLAKILGGQKTDADLVLLEEHVIGVPLNKLQELALARQTSVPIGVSVKLILDVLRAAVALRQGCSNQNLLNPGRTIFPDSVMVANFGEALLTGVGVTQELGRCRIIREHPDMADVLDPFEPVTTNSKQELFEVFTAGAMLWKMLVIQSLFNNYSNQKTLKLVLHSNVLSAEYSERLNLCVPRPIADVIRCATQANHGLRYQSLQEMISELELVPSALLSHESQVRTWLERIAGGFFSGLQHSSGVRRVPVELQPASPASPSLQRSSTIDTLLPGFRAPVAARVPPFFPTESGYSHEPTSSATTGPDSCPATAVTSFANEPVEPKHRIRKAYVIGTLLGVGLSLGLSYLGSRFSSRTTSTASTVAPGQISTKTEYLSPSDRASAAMLAAPGQDSGAARPMASSETSGTFSGQKARAAKAVSRDYSLVDPKDSKRSNATASPSGTSALTAPSPSHRNRWGI